LYILFKIIKSESRIKEIQGGFSYLTGLGIILFVYGTQLYTKADLITSGYTDYFLSLEPDLVSMIFSILVGGILGILLGWIAIVPFIIIIVVYIFVDTTGEFLIRFLGVMLILPLTRTAGKIGIQVLAVNMIVPTYIAFLILVTIKASENSGWNVIARSALAMGLFFFIAYVWYRLFDWATDHRYHESFHGVWQRSFGRYGRRKGDDQVPHSPEDESKYPYAEQYYKEQDNKRKEREEASSNASTGERRN
jgi:glucan phosphoethanolaminetransferase (alkaline phosphatase superfamily)